MSVSLVGWLVGVLWYTNPCGKFNAKYYFCICIISNRKFFGG